MPVHVGETVGGVAARTLFGPGTHVFEVSQVHEFEQGLFRYLETYAHKTLRSITETKVLSEESENELKEALTAYIAEFKKTH